MALASALLAVSPARALAPASEIALPGCTTPPALAAELSEPQRIGARCGGDAACWSAALNEARATRDRFADQYDAHRAYLLVARAAARTLGSGILAPLVAEYSELAAAHPSNAAYAHLSAQLALEGADYRRRLEQLAERFPDYPWAQLSLAFQARSGAGGDDWEGARAALARFLALCPERVEESARGLEMVGDRALVEAHAARLRELALARGDAAALAILWPLSVQAAADDQRDGVRSAVAAELAAFAQGEGAASLAGLRTLHIGYEAVGDEAGRRRAEDGLLALAPCGDEAVRIRSARFRQAHPPLKEGDRAAREAWLEAALADVEAVLRECPADEAASGLRVELLASAPVERNAALLAAVDRLLALPPRRLALSPSTPGWEASLYVERALRLDRVPALLESDLADAKADRERATAAGEPTAEARFAYRRRESLRIRIGYSLAVGDAAGARRALDELAGETAAAPGRGLARAFPGAPHFPDERTSLDLLAARVLTAEGRAEEALTLLARLLPDPLLRPTLDATARRAWRVSRASDEGYEAWVSALASGLAATPWHSVDRPLPAASLTEFGGGPWNWEAQRGRTVVVGLWATWCAPSRDELPWLERLKERLADRPDVSFVALNVERTNGSLIPFLAESGPKLPVVMGGDALFEEGLIGVPTIWIVAPDGRIRRELQGFAGGGEEWLSAALAEVAAVAGPAPSAGDGP